MDLPPELLDEIISHIPSHDKKSFRNCSLVAKSWIYPSRRRLFEFVDIWEDAHLKSWLGTIPPTNIEVLQHVRSLLCNCQLAERPDSPCGFDYHLRHYSPSLRQLERLTIILGRLTSPTHIGMPSAFQYTLSYLCLWGCRVTVSTLATIVNYFPSLTHLDLVSLSHETDDQPIPPFSRPLRHLTITESLNTGSLNLLDQLMDQRPQCDEVTVGVLLASSPSLAQRVVDGVDTRIKRLNLASDLSDVGNPLTLSGCRELQELEIHALCPGVAEQNLISSITSTNIRRIAFTQSVSPHEEPESENPDWAQLDNSLCRLVDRLESGLRLEVEFRALAKRVQRDVLDFKKLLPRFCEKGGVIGEHEK